MESFVCWLVFRCTRFPICINIKYLVRLSAATATKLLDANPDIADLSDPFRPEKIGEGLSGLYDDQWTDASEALEALGLDEEAILKTLLDLLIVSLSYKIT